MASRKPADTQRPKVMLPDLPRPLFPDMEPGVDERRSVTRPAAQRAPRARVEHVSSRRQMAPVRRNAPPPARARSQNEMIVLPSPRQIAGQIVPSLVAAVSLWLSGHGAELLSPLGVPLWVIILLGPTLFLFLAANGLTHPFWRNAALANIATISIAMPILALRRFTIAVPSFEHGHGVLLAPVVASVAAVLVMVALALGIAIATREDPEYAGLLLLPAALMVPMCVGMSSESTLAGWLSASAGVYIAAGLATVVASLLPGTLAALVAPGAIALEFLFLTVIKRTPVFPHASGATALLLFWCLLVVVVSLLVLLPVVSQWFGRVDRRARAIEYATA